MEEQDLKETVDYWQELIDDFDKRERNYQVREFVKDISKVIGVRNMENSGLCYEVLMLDGTNRLIAGEKYALFFFFFHLFISFSTLDRASLITFCPEKIVEFYEQKYAPKEPGQCLS